MAVRAATVSPEQLVGWYRTMRTIREFEERLHVELATGEIPGLAHLSAGQEAVAAGVIAHLGPDDAIASTHRGHGHAIAKGCDVKAMMAEVYGKRTGSCRGKGGSMHIADLDLGMLGANGIVGGGPPLACGAALSAKIRGTTQVAVAFTGDGGANQGTTLESLNLAAVWTLPCVFVVENNGYAQSTGTAFSTSGIDIARRADGFGMPGVVVDGHDVVAVHEAAGEAIARARDGGGPTLLEMKVSRFFGHVEGEAQTYRAPGEVDRIREHADCLVALRRLATSAAPVADADLDAIDAEVRRLIDAAVRDAKAAPDPAPADLHTDVYTAY